jgi:hypothetical protein
MKTAISTFTISLALLCISCKSSSSSQSASGPVNDYHLPDKITLTASAVRDASGGTVIEGTTNLPDESKLGLELMIGNRTTAQDFDVFVVSGKFHSARFERGASPLPAGKQKVHIFTYFNTNWQSESVLKLVGTGGGNLKPSEVIRSEDPQLIDGDKDLQYTIDLTTPPLANTPSNSATASQSQSMPSDKAIALVKNAILVVDGSRSSETVEGGIRYYFSAGPSIRMGNGWSATLTAKDSFTVVLDFVNTVGTTEQHDVAIWEANLVTKKVLYRNKNAKGFSWIPRD